MKKPTVSLIIGVYNVEDVVIKSLKSVYVQTYPISEIILIDNHSSDNSVAVIRRFFERHKKIPYTIVKRKQTYGISESYNLGARLAKSSYIVTLHSDSVLPSRFELERLMRPFIEKKNQYIASMPLVVHRKYEWYSYNFWQKCLFAQVVGCQSHSLNGKFDAYVRTSYLSLGGYDTRHFSHSVGSEDADMHFRVSRLGAIAHSKARVIHMHPRNEAYFVHDWIIRRKFLANAYAAQLRLHWRDMSLFSILVFFFKPVLVCALLLTFWMPYAWIGVGVFPFLYMNIMFRDSTTRSQREIIVLPFVVWYLLVAESVWMLRSLFQPAIKV